MLKLIDTVNFPEWALCYWHYADSSSLEPDDIKQVDTFNNQYSDYKFITLKAIEEESSFTTSPEFGLACNCIETEVWGELKSHCPHCGARSCDCLKDIARLNQENNSELNNGA